MIYFIFGKDTFRSKEKIRELVDFFRQKNKEAEIFRIGGENFDPFKMEEFAKSQGLFSKKYLVVCDGVLENNGASKYFEQNIKKFSDSPNIFFFREEEPEEKILKIFKEHSERVQEFKLLTGAKLKEWIKKRRNLKDREIEGIIEQCGSNLWCVVSEIEKGRFLEKVKIKQKYNPFSICDAISEKNKTKAWILLQQALLSGVPAEEIFYKVMWQIKVLLMVLKGVIKDLHPFVLQKTLRNIINFNERELVEKSYNLLKIYHEVRNGNKEFDIELEKFLLKI